MRVSAACGGDLSAFPDADLASADTGGDSELELTESALEPDGADGADGAASDRPRERSRSGRRHRRCRCRGLDGRGRGWHAPRTVPLRNMTPIAHGPSMKCPSPTRERMQIAAASAELPAPAARCVVDSNSDSVTHSALHLNVATHRQMCSHPPGALWPTPQYSVARYCVRLAPPIRYRSGADPHGAPVPPGTTPPPGGHDGSGAQTRPRPHHHAYLQLQAVDAYRSTDYK